jgi:F420-dependent oxidoreductase-like protein
VKVGVDVEGQDGLTWERWRHLAARVEELGYESLWRSDHFCSVVGRVERPALEAWTSLAYLATATSRIRFGPLVTPVTFRHPSLLALTAAAVDELSGGRLEVGLGAGWEAHEHEAFGVPFPPMPVRFELLEECIDVLKSLWTDEEAHYAGRHYTLRGAHGHPKPAQRPHPPIVVGGTGEKRTLRVVAKHADEWNAHGVTPEVYRAKRAVLERHCEEVGRDPGEIAHSICAPLVVGESDEEVTRSIDALARYFPLRASAFFPDGDDTDNSPDAVRARGWFAGRPGQVVEQIAAFEAEGVHRVIVQVMPHDGDALELFAASVLPHVSRKDEEG